MIPIRGTTWLLMIALCGAIWFAISQHPDKSGAIVLCAIGVFVITFATAAFLMRGK